MKKVILILICLGMLCLCACGSETKTPDISGNITVETDTPDPAPEADSAEPEPSEPEPAEPTVEELFAEVRGIYSCPYDGAEFFIRFYEAEGALQYEDGYLYSDLLSRGTVSDYHPENEMMVVTVDFSGDEPYSIVLKLDLTELAAGTVKVHTQTGAELTLTYRGPDFDHLS